MSLDLNAINSCYNNYNMDTATDSAGKLEETLKSDLSTATEEELMDVCKDFEAYFVEQMFKAMQRMVPESEEDVSASTRQLKDYYKEQMTQSFAEQATEGEGLGIAQILYDQMKRNYGLE
ncbi:rod-binding protein [Lachnospiraceae bacterium KK002]